ncbi:TPA_asm: maturation protein [ssRNA phage Zoerhiza.2_13]|uniref:Maturation protein n=2 Tax=Leviviricetes TaxID=2842243 RepID=A0A8S5L335_9VIRU|nr:maturation protein [ssRNA phage Zoerhiza.2_13]QDH91251.1 MAG: hypothetical protein H2Rhizo31738_000003 [Leviviridae sp.]DAD51570.1 TPA_asm: maturation protein [ssRNA phage Zoerhiza.2_13]
MTLKYRAFAGATFTTYDTDSPTNNGKTQMAGGGYESIDSVNHNLSLLGKTDCGGPMILNRDISDISAPIISGGRFNGSQLILQPVSLSTGHPGVTSDASMNASGATAIARTIPTEPVFQSITALSELRSDGIPSLPGLESWRSRTLKAHNAGSEYLNVEFGWLPLVNDIRTFAKSVKNHHSILDDYKAGAGHTTRVGFSFPGTSDFSATQGSCLSYLPGNSGISRALTCSYTYTKEQSTWFKGAFRYYLPVGDDVISKSRYYAALADKLLGIKPTPEAIYNASPWTWALDWFTNSGDIVRNISQIGQNGLVLKYGYIMSQALTHETWVVPSGPWRIGNSSAGSMHRRREFKKRLPANPYGFGVSDGSLSNTQKAIVAALGLSRSKSIGRG